MADRKKSKQREAKAYAFNWCYLLYALGFLLSLWSVFYLLIEENTWSWILAAILFVFAAALCFDSVYYIFTKQDIFFVHIGGYQRRLPWLYVNRIVKHSCLPGVRHIPGYEVIYQQPRKNRTVQKSTLLALTPKVKRSLQQFYIGEILGEETEKRKPRRKKK